MDMTKLNALLKNKKAALKPKDKTIKPQPGANRYVLLPGWRKEEQHVWYHDFGQHFIKDAAGAIQAVYPCSYHTFGTPCAVCSGINSAMHAAADDETIEALKGSKSAKTFLLNVLALDSEDPTTPQILEIKTSAFGQLVDAVEEWAATMFDTDNAQIFVINRDGKGFNTKHTVQVSPKRQAVPATAMAKLNNLDEYVAQTNEENERRALTAVNSVAGIAMAPRNADKPSTPTALIAGGEERVAAANARKPALAESLDDLLEDLA